LISVAALPLCHGTMPLPIGPHPGEPAAMVISSSIALLTMVLEIGLVALITRRRALPDLAARAPERSVALRETIALWLYGALVLLAGRFIGLYFFGEAIAMHLNGSLVGATRVQSPAEVYTWAAYNGIFLALVPYVVFRMRGYSNQQLNLKSSNLKSDVIVIAVVLAIGCFMDLTLDGNFLKLTQHQQIVGGLLTFVLHLFGTDLPIMIFIYSVLMPRYAKLTAPVTAFLLGAASYRCVPDFLSSGPDEIISYSAHRERLGPRLGLPRHHTSRHNRHSVDRPRLRYSLTCDAAKLHYGLQPAPRRVQSMQRRGT
jgi:hypothetical protein